METKVKRNGKGGGGKEGNHFVSSKGSSVISFLILRSGKLLFSRDQQIKNISFRLEYLTLDRSHFFPPRTRVKKMQECAIWSICTTLMRLINAFTTIWYLYGREGLNFIGRTERQPQSPCGSCVRAQVKRQIGRSSADTDQ